MESRLVVEDELIFSRITTRDLAAEIFAQEQVSFATPPKPVTRVGDMTDIQLNDMMQLMREMVPMGYPVSFRKADKYDSDAAMAHMRAGMQRKHIIIHKCCTGLIDQLESGTQDDKGKFDRSDKHGHFDAIAALKYMWREAFKIRRMNPFPDDVLPRSYWEPSWERSGGKVSVTRTPLSITRNRLR